MAELQTVLCHDISINAWSKGWSNWGACEALYGQLASPWLEMPFIRCDEKVDYDGRLYQLLQKMEGTPLVGGFCLILFSRPSSNYTCWNILSICGRAAVLCFDYKKRLVVPIFIVYHNVENPPDILQHGQASTSLSRRAAPNVSVIRMWRAKPPCTVVEV